MSLHFRVDLRGTDKDTETKETMRFAVCWRCGETKARAGTLHLARHSLVLHTPCLLLPTRKGLPPFIPPDHLPDLHSDALVLLASPLHFLDGPSPKTLDSVGGLHNLVGLPNFAMAAVARDSIVCYAEPDGSNKLGASFQTPSGRRLVSPAEYMDIVNAMQPDIWSSLPDEIPASATRKRNKLSVARTLNWLDQCLALQKIEDKSLLGCIVGGASVEERIYSAKETSNRDVAGFSICGFGLGESAEERRSLLDSIISNLPSEKVRHLCGLGMPEEVLQAVSTGVDIFDSTYPQTLTMGGYAMTFSTNMKELHDNANADIGSDTTKINLRAVCYRNDMTPILKDCHCYTCVKHTKAYINHLLNTHEMLAQTLLDIHNTHHYLNFFRAIKESIRGGYFAKFHTWFVSQRREVAQTIPFLCTI